MNITIYGHSLKVTSALRSHVKEQFNKIDKFENVFLSVHVVFEVIHGLHTAKCTVKVPHSKDLHAECTTDDMYKSIDELSLKIQNQLRKAKELSTEIDHETLVLDDNDENIDE